MEKKSLATNSLFFILYRLINMVFPLITVTYVSNVILASGVGKVASAQNIARYFVLLASLGIPNYGVREIARCSENIKQRNLLFSELFFKNAASTMLCFIGYYLLLMKTDISQGNIALYAIVGIEIFLNFFNVDWFYYGNEEYSYIAIRSFYIKIISLLLMYIMIRKPSDYIGYAFIYVIGTASNNIINFVNLRKYEVQITLKNLNIWKHWKSVMVLACTVFAIELYTLFDTTMLTFMASDEVVGYYSNSMKIVKVVITLITAVGGVILPRLTYYYSKGMRDKCTTVVNVVFKIMFFLFMPCMIGIALLADVVIPILFGVTFMEAIPTLRIASLLIFALGFSNLFGRQVLLTFGDEKKLLIATICGAISNLLLNLLLIPRFMQNGAVVASICSECIVTIMTFIFARKRLPITLDLPVILKCSISSVAMVSGILVIRLFMHNEFLVLILSVTIGAIIYFVMNIIIKNPVVRDFRDILKK